MQMPGAKGKGRKVCPKSKSQCKPLRRPHRGKAAKADQVTVVEAEDAVKAGRATVEVAAVAKADREVPGDRAVQVGVRAASVNISARRKSASFVSRRWT